MDFWNRKKVRELQEECDRLKREHEASLRTCDRRKEEIDILEKKLRGERVCGEYCKTCAHSIEQEQYAYGGVYKTYICGLECKCKDFQRKGAEAE